MAGTSVGNLNKWPQYHKQHSEFH